MGTVNSHSASVRVSPVCGNQKLAQPRRIEGISRTSGSEPHLATTRIVYRRVGSNYSNDLNGENKKKNDSSNYTSDFNGFHFEIPTNSRNGLFEATTIPAENNAWTRNVSQKKICPKSLKQASHNSTNSSYIPDCSPDGSMDRTEVLDPYANFVTANEHLHCHTSNVNNNMNGGILETSINGFSKELIYPRIQTNHQEELLQKNNACCSDSQMSNNTDFSYDSRMRLIHPRHLSELCLHLDEVRSIPSPNPHLSSACTFIPNFECVDSSNNDPGPFVRMSSQSTSMYQQRSKSPFTQANSNEQTQSSYYINKSISNYLSQPVDIEPTSSPFTSEINLIDPDVGNDHHDYVNLPQARTRYVKYLSKHNQLATKNELSPQAFEQMSHSSLRSSKPRWRFMTRGKSLTKSISCYALKFFNQQTRSYEITELPVVPSGKRTPPCKQITKETQQRKSAALARDASTGEIFDDLGQIIQRALRISEESDEREMVQSNSSNRFTSKINRSLSAFGNREIPGQRQTKALRRITPNDLVRRDRKTLLQISTKELLHCLSVFIMQQCNRLSHGDPSIYPEELVSWIRDIDRALVQQGWTDIPFINPANVVFLFVILKGSITANISSCLELHSIIMVCLYLSYGYMGNEISYPLKPFLNADILYNSLYDKDSVQFRTNVDLLPTRNPKIVNHFRDLFWEKCLRVIKTKSKHMLQLNADPTFFTESIAELRSYGSPKLKST